MAITSAYRGDILPITNVREYPGRGIEGVMNEKIVRLGSRSWCGKENVENTAYLELWLNVEEDEPVSFVFSDILRTDSVDTIHEFHQVGLHPVLLSGDREPIVRKIARSCSIDTYKAEFSPQEKYAYMESLKQQGHKVLMIGDGLNDAPTLAGASISIAPGTAISLSQNAADIIFMGEKLGSVFTAYNTARTAQKLVKQNFLLSIAYNAIAIPLAALGFLTPFFAAIAMSGSSLIVILNSFRIRK